MTLADELKNDQGGRGYAHHLPHDPEKVVAILNAKTEMLAKERWVTGLEILSECDSGKSIVRKLKALALQDAVVEIAWARLLGNKGVNVFDPKTIETLEELVQAGALDEDEAAQIKAMAVQPASRAEVLGIPAPTARDIVDAWEAE